MAEPTLGLLDSPSSREARFARFGIDFRQLQAKPNYGFYSTSLTGQSGLVFFSSSQDNFADKANNRGLFSEMGICNICPVEEIRTKKSCGYCICGSSNLDFCTLATLTAK
jgi:hypothetical protein